MIIYVHIPNPLMTVISNGKWLRRNLVFGFNYTPKISKNLIELKLGLKLVHHARVGMHDHGKTMQKPTHRPAWLPQEQVQMADHKHSFWMLMICQC